jgi:hypothetical protein
MPLHTQQLEIRYIEVLEAFKAFKALVNGNEAAFIDDVYLHWDSWKNQVNTDAITFVGHSFGGCTAVRHFFISMPRKGGSRLSLSYMF